MRNNRTVKGVFASTLIFVLLVSGITSFPFAAETYSSEYIQTYTNDSKDEFVRPVIYHKDSIDKDFDGIQDSLQSKFLQATTNKSTVLPIIVTLYNPVLRRELDYFKTLGGHVTHVYHHVTYGFAGTIPASNISAFVDFEGENLNIVEYDASIRYYLDVSVPLIRVRPIVWKTYGYTGSPNHSIAIVDTGIDDSHPDVGPYGELNFSRKIIGWYDTTGDGASTPQDYGEHGTHVAAIAAGTGAANKLQDLGSVQTTFTYRLPQINWGYADYFDILTPGAISLSVTWDGPNTVELRIDDPAGNPVKWTIGANQPLTLTYNTVGTAYPTGRYRVVVFNLGGPTGTPFSCVETYPYAGLNDGYNLFTGVAPDSKLVGIKVFDNTGSGTLSTLIAGLDWIIANRMTYHIVVASMSLGLENGAVDTTLDQKADTLVMNGIVTTVSAGNDFPDYTIGSPGTAAYVLTVAATNDQNGITSYSSNGETSKNEYGLIKPDVAAPGGSLAVGNLIISADSNDVDYGYSGQSDYTSNDYQAMAGTSMSTPHVAGIASLIIDALASWNWTVKEALKVKMIISMTAFEVQSGETNLPPLNRGEKDNKEGYGRVCADAAIEAVTMNYTVGELATETLGSNPSDKKVWVRRVSLSAGSKYEFNLSVPSGADYDLYIYNGSPDSYGQPIILQKSVNSSSGAEERIRFTPTYTGTYYILVRWVNGDGAFNLTSSVVKHNVAVFSVEPSTNEVYAGRIVNITVVAGNEGTVAENFNVTAKYDNNTIATQTVSNLPPNGNITLTFSWDTSTVTAYINYSIKAEASIVEGETNVADNSFVDGVVKVKYPGDVNEDGVVDLDDLYIVVAAFGTTQGMPTWDSRADLAPTYGLIDLKDMFVVVSHFGETH